MYSPSYDTLDVPPSQDSEDDDQEEEEEEEEDASQATEEGSTLQHADTAVAPSSSLSQHASITAVASLDFLNSTHREISHAAVCWQLSSAKPGNGVEQLRDPSDATFWQSDGVNHYVELHFHRRVPVSHVALYLDYQLDESYTPKTILVETGMTSQDLQPAGDVIELHEPQGWCVIPIACTDDEMDDGEDSGEGRGFFVKTHLVRISILSMHQNGRDTHVRRLAVFAPRQLSPSAPDAFFHDASSSTKQMPLGDRSQDNPHRSSGTVHPSLAWNPFRAAPTPHLFTTIR
jgi:anaphase-promoting complex subunit 10